MGNFKNVNYETSNIDLYKKDFTNEAHGAIGLLNELKLQKKVNNTNHLFTPKFMIKYAPGSMRQETDGEPLDPYRAFSMNRAENLNNFEKGLSGAIGFDYKIKNNNKDFDFSIAQVVNEKENKKMSSESSLDEKLSRL